MFLFTKFDMESFNLTDKFLVCTLVLWLVSISMQILFSSKTLYINLEVMLGISKFRDWSSDSKFLYAITSRSATESAMYYDSVVLSAIKCCILDDHIIGQPSNMRTYPVLECDEIWLFISLSCHDPSKSAST